MFDSHAHYDDKRYDGERQMLLDEIFNSGVQGIINVGCDLKSSRLSLDLANKYDNIYAAAGVHPHSAKDVGRDYLEQLALLLNQKKVVALGEIGLDYHYNFSPPETQKIVFRQQMDLARKLGMPVIIHDREAHKDCIDTALEFKNVTGVFHSFSGSAESAEIIVKAGWYISFSGVVTFKNANKLLLAVKTIPEDRLLVETDCPYLTPHPFRGKCNNSIYMRHTIEAIAKIRGTDFEHIRKVTADNAKRLFDIK